MTNDQNITYIRGDSLEIPVTVSLDESRTLDGTESWKWQIKRDVESRVLVSKTSPSSGITVDGSTNQPTVVIDPADFPILEFPSSVTDQVYIHELQMTKSGKVETILRGRFTVQSDVVQ